MSTHPGEWTVAETLAEMLASWSPESETKVLISQDDDGLQWTEFWIRPDRGTNWYRLTVDVYGERAPFEVDEFGNGKRMPKPVMDGG